MKDLLSNVLMNSLIALQNELTNVNKNYQVIMPNPAKCDDCAYSCEGGCAGRCPSSCSHKHN